MTGAAVLLLFASFVAIYAYGENPSVPDVPRYYQYGYQTAHGSVPYRDFRIEYPPAALVVFILPTYGGGLFGPVGGASWSPGPNAAAVHYSHAFAALMIALVAVSIVLTSLSLSALPGSLGTSLIALGLLGAAPILLGGVVYTRYDFWPAALTAAAVAAVLRGRLRLGSIALGVGIAAKLYPLALLPLFVTYVWKRRGRLEALRVVALTAAVSLAIFLPVLVLAPGRTLFAVREQLGRGLQVESLGSAVVVALHLLTTHLHRLGLPIGVLHVRIRNAGNGLATTEIRGQAATWAALASSLVLVCLLGLLWTRFARRPARDHLFVRYCAATLVALLAFGHVLSPQLLIWLLPIVPLIGGRRGLTAAILLGLALLTTHIWFASYYQPFVERPAAGPAMLLLARDLTLVLLFATLTWPMSATPWLKRLLPAAP